MITFCHKGNFDKTENFLKKASKRDIMSILNKFGELGVKALSSSTPVDTGVTAASWNYSVENKNGQYSIYWTNSNTVNGVPIAIMLQYGHSSKNGGFVSGRDYINPAIRPIFDNIANEAWKEVLAL